MDNREFWHILFMFLVHQCNHGLEIVSCNQTCPKNKEVKSQNISIGVVAVLQSLRNQIKNDCTGIKYKFLECNSYYTEIC